jgi:hypothetical protein
LRIVRGGREAEVSDSDALFLKLVALWGVAGRSRSGREAQRQFVAHLRSSGALDGDQTEQEAA